ncbi:hypothetical protein FO519_009081 [Halicephalobus sp. NKZ332]|nr:hypothetical protein FO519_009081 [Halicephalobus sp. NKZ332]
MNSSTRLPPSTELPPSTSTGIFPHTHPPNNLTLPNVKKSPISHLEDLDSDNYAFLRFLFVIALIGGAIGIWLMIKFKIRVRKESGYGSRGSSAEYKPLRVDDVLDMSSGEDEDDDVILKLAG